MSQDDDFKPKTNPSDNTGTSISGQLLFSTNLSGFYLDIEVYDPTLNLSEEELKAFMKVCKQALKTVLEERFQKLECIGKVIE